jgi:acyl-CoA synthetase (AMP-forming)/AMP-acid ligase II
MVTEVAQSGAARAERIIRCAYPDVAIPEVTITEFVLGAAARRGDKPAIIDGSTGRTLTYAELASSVRRVAAGLAAHGLSKGEVLGIYSPNVPQYAVAFHAAARIGGVVTTVNPLYTPRELVQQLNDSRASYLLTVPAFMESAREAARQVPSIREIFVLGDADGATSFASLLTHGDQPPQVSINPREDLTG